MRGLGDPSAYDDEEIVTSAVDNQNDVRHLHDICYHMDSRIVQLAIFPDVYDAEPEFERKENMPPLSAENIVVGDVVVVESHILEHRVIGSVSEKYWRRLRLSMIAKLG